MIVANICGGLGNQMFQYAAARSVALRSQQALFLDISWYAQQDGQPTQRAFLLDQFQIQASIATPDILSVFDNIDSDNDSSGNAAIVREKSFSFEAIAVRPALNAYLHGYWQSEKYFLDCADHIGAELRPNKDFQIEKNVVDVLQSGCSVGLHVRRGDFANVPATNAAHGLCSAEYYTRAAEVLVEWLGIPHFLVFSDDHDWCREHLRLPGSISYIGDGNAVHPVRDFFLLSQCRHFVIANSSFSWWAAWLSQNPNKIVIAPQKLVEGDWIDTKDYFPLRWFRVN